MQATFFLSKTCFPCTNSVDVVFKLVPQTSQLRNNIRSLSLLAEKRDIWVGVTPVISTPSTHRKMTGLFSFVWYWASYLKPLKIVPYCPIQYNKNSYQEWQKIWNHTKNTVLILTSYREHCLLNSMHVILSIFDIL